MKADSIVKALAGSYHLINTTSYLNGSLTPTRFNNETIGILTYTEWGYMSANLASTDPSKRPQTIFWPPSDGESAEDWALACRNSMSYAGRFRINTDLPASATSGQVLHGPMEIASVPTMVNATQVRNYTVVKEVPGGDTILVIWVESPGLRALVYWRRID